MTNRQEGTLVRKDNVSTILLMPCIQIRKELFAQFQEYGFVNTYLFWDKISYPFEVIFMVFRPAGMTVGYQNFITNMQKNQNYVETHDIGETIVLVFSIPKRFKRDYKLFLQGKYSQTSNDFKSCFALKVYKVDDTGKVEKDESGRYITEYTTFYHIFNRTDELRSRWQEVLGEETVIPEEMELYDKYDKEKETLNI